MSSLAVQPQLECKLQILSGSQKGSVFKILSSKITIGRDPSNDIQILKDTDCSRQHAVIEFLQEGIVITEVSKNNRMSLSGVTTKKGVLKNNTRFKIGNTEFLFVIQENSQALMASPGGAIASGSRPHSQKTRNKKRTKQKGPLFYVLYIGLPLLLVWLIFSENKKSKKRTVDIKTQQEVEKNLEKSEKVQQELEKLSRESGVRNPSFLQAQKFYLSGSRDYKNGNYDRALDAFQTCISLYREHTLCQRYSLLSQKQLDRLRQINMLLGREYLENNQYKQCVQAFKFVMTSVKDRNSKMYKEAYANMSICDEKLRGRF